MTQNQYPDADIIDYPQLRPALAGLAIIMPSMVGVLPVPIDPPEKHESRGARPLSEMQTDLRDALCCVVLDAYAMLRAAYPDWSELEIEDKLDSYVRAPLTVRSAREKGREVVRHFYGIAPRELELGAQAAFNAAEGSEAHIAGKLGLVEIMSRAYARARLYDSALYKAFHGRDAEAFTTKMSAAIDPKPEHAPLDLPKAARVALMSGVNPTFLWQTMWKYRFPLEVCASLHRWITHNPAELFVEEYYTLFRCVESTPAKAGDDWDHLRCLIRNEVEQHVGIDLFMREAVPKLERHGLLTERPATVGELFARSLQVDADTPDEHTVELLHPYRTMRLV